MAVRKDKKGLYVADVRDHKGIRIRKKFQKKSEAETFIARHENIKREHRLIDSKVKKARPTFAKALDDFLEQKKTLRPKSYQKYKFIVGQFRLFTEQLDIMYLDEFTTDDADLLRQELVKEKMDPKGNTDKIMKPKPKTVNFFIQTIKAFFRDEVTKGHLARNPVQHLKNERVEKKRADYYTAKDLNEFFSQEMDPAYENAFLGLLFSGMRVGELESLTWEDVDLVKKIIHIRNKEGFKTKTYYSERDIPMNKALLKLITKLSKDKASDRYVFTSPEGKQVRERKLLTVCKEVAGKAKINGRAYLHKFRHTYATHLVQRKVPIEAIQKLLGHSSITETMIYAHVKSDELHTEVSRIDDLVGFDSDDDQV